jgi:F-type H+-transporting ATPase subunit epsilon
VAHLQVDIVTPERQVFSGHAVELRAPGWNGEFDILPGHALYLSLLRGGTLTVVTEAGAQRFVVGRGFAEAGPDRVTILTEDCVAADAADRSSAQQELTAAESELLALNAFDEAALAKIEAQLERARAIVTL